MSKSISCLSYCNHYVNGKSYPAELCPRCYGKNYYIDLAFDFRGEIVTASNSIKLQQDLIKILLDEKGSDLFYPNWGNESYMFIGQKNTLITKSRLEVAIRRTLDHLKTIQEHDASVNNAVTADEVLQSIDNISIEATSPTQWNVTIQFSNQANMTYNMIVTL